MDDSYSPERTIATIAPVPLLLIHGTSDRVVPISHAQRLHELAGEPKRFVIVPGGGHTEAFAPRFGATYRDVVAEFFEAALAQ